MDVPRAVRAAFRALLRRVVQRAARDPGRHGEGALVHGAMQRHQAQPRTRHGGLWLGRGGDRLVAADPVRGPGQ